MTGQAIAIFDRDDTLLVDRHFMHDPADICWMAGAREAIGLLKSFGYLVCVATNQSSIARGYFTEDQMHAFHLAMQASLGDDLPIDGFFYCPHHPEGAVTAYARSCDCRKPMPGMLHEIDRQFGIDRRRSFLVGDKPRDIQAANAFGIAGYLFEGGSLYRFVEKILRQQSERP